MSEQETGRGRRQKQERRRRNTDALAGKRRRLSLNERALDKENYAYYWARDDQIEMLTQEDDWEIVQDRDNKIKRNSNGMGADVSTHAGTSETGSGQRQVLLRKPRQYQDEDEAARMRRADEIEAQMRRESQTGINPDDGMKFRSEVGQG